MRLDKFLKVSRLVKRRTVANELASKGHVAINGQQAKAASTVKEGDVLSLRFGDRLTRVRVVKIVDFAPKDQAHEMYEILDGEE